VLSSITLPAYARGSDELLERCVLHSATLECVELEINEQDLVHLPRLVQVSARGVRLQGFSDADDDAWKVGGGRQALLELARVLFIRGGEPR
jgi:hypothetical protein